MRTTLDLLVDGWRALVKELGLGEALRYQALFQPGRGDYAREREQFLGQDLEREIKEWEGKKGA
jgi:hypothetical protein